MAAQVIQVREPLQVILARAEFSPMCIVTPGSAPLDDRDSRYGGTRYQNRRLTPDVRLMYRCMVS